MSRLVIDDTGEILTTLEHGDRIIRAASVDSMASFETIPQGEMFTKLYRSIVPQLVKCNLSAAEFMVFMHLATNLRYMSNVAKYSNGNLITRENLIHDLHMPEVTVKRSVKRLRDVGLVVEANTIEGRVFIVNPYVVMVGDKVNKTVFDLFRKSQWARW